jgi:hypothetical protein
MAQPLDYQARDRLRDSRSLRRYLILMFVVAFAYIVIYALDFFYELHHFDDTNWNPSKAYIIFGKIVCFPLLDFFDPAGDLGIASIIAVLNALICGFWFAGCAYVLSLVIARSKRRIN